MRASRLKDFPSRCSQAPRFRAVASSSSRPGACTRLVRRPRKPSRARRSMRQPEKGDGPPAWVQVAPTELVLKPGQTVTLHARLFDAKGRFLREETGATWSLQGLKATIDNGTLAIAADPVDQAGTDQGDHRRVDRRSPRAGDPSTAVDRDVRFVCRRRCAAGMDQRGDREVLGGDAGGSEGPAEGAGSTRSSSGFAFLSARSIWRTTHSRPTCVARPGVAR